MCLAWQQRRKHLQKTLKSEVVVVVFVDDVYNFQRACLFFWGGRKGCKTLREL